MSKITIGYWDKNRVKFLVHLLPNGVISEIHRKTDFHKTNGVLWQYNKDSLESLKCLCEHIRSEWIAAPMPDTHNYASEIAAMLTAMTKTIGHNDQYKNSQHKELTDVLGQIKLRQLMRDYPSMNDVDIAELISDGIDKMRTKKFAKHFVL